MEYDKDAAVEKKRSLINAVQRLSYESLYYDEATASSIIDSFATITPPEKPEMVMELITLDGRKRPKGRSKKPGNVLLNWRKLVEKVPEATLAVLGVSTIPHWAVPLAALSIWNSLNQSATEEFSSIEAIIMLALWKNRNARNKISEGDGFKKTNILLSELSLPTINETDFTISIDRLIRIRCLQLENGIIWLREWISVKY